LRAQKPSRVTAPEYYSKCNRIVQLQLLCISGKMISMLNAPQ
jgi:hypothetical protein